MEMNRALYQQMEQLPQSGGDPRQKLASGSDVLPMLPAGMASMLGSMLTMNIGKVDTETQKAAMQRMMTIMNQDSEMRAILGMGNTDAMAQDSMDRGHMDNVMSQPYQPPKALFDR